MVYTEYGMYLIIILVVFLMVYWPRKRQEKLIRAMQEEIKVGKNITTYSGITGEIISVVDENVIIEIQPDGIKFTIKKWAIMEINE